MARKAPTPGRAPRVVRLSDLSPAQRHLVLSLAAMAQAEPATEKAAERAA